MSMWDWWQGMLSRPWQGRPRHLEDSTVLHCLHLLMIVVAVAGRLSFLVQRCQEMHNWCA